MEKHNLVDSFTRLKLSDSSHPSNSFPFEQSCDHLSTSESSKTTLVQSQSHGEKSLRTNLSFSFPLSKIFCKSIQQKISKSSHSELKAIIDSMLPLMSNFMVDSYGNYICQTLFHTCSADQRLTLLMSLQGKLVEIAFDSKGTHSLQILISMASLKQEEKLYQNEFQGHVVSMSLDINASHVIQMMMTTFSNTFFIIQEVKNNARTLATDKFGVCLLKKCCQNPEIMTEVIKESLFFMQHPYGNYVIQSIIEIWKDEIGFEFADQIRGKITQLCLQKFSSNVIEKAVKVEYIKNCILNEISTSDRIKELLMSQYGCYVLRTVSKSADRNFKMVLESCFEDPPKGSNKLNTLWREIKLEINKIS